MTQIIIQKVYLRQVYRIQENLYTQNLLIQTPWCCQRYNKHTAKYSNFLNTFNTIVNVKPHDNVH